MNAIQNSLNLLLQECIWSVTICLKIFDIESQQIHEISNVNFRYNFVYVSKSHATFASATSLILNHDFSVSYRENKIFEAAQSVYKLVVLQQRSDIFFEYFSILKLVVSVVNVLQELNGFFKIVTLRKYNVCWCKYCI
jgi:hypothetical protein